MDDFYAPLAETGVFSDWLYLVDQMKPYYQLWFDLDRNPMNFKDAYLYAESSLASIFEDHNLNMRYQEDQLAMLRMTRKKGLLLRYTDFARQLYMTKMLKEPLDLLQRAFDETIESLKAGAELSSITPKQPMLIYSVESQQIANML